MKTEAVSSPAQFADRRAVAMGCEDKRINGCSPEFTGIVEINSIHARVLRSCNFSGTLHYGILGRNNGENFCGWVPAFLCNIPSDQEAARIAKAYGL